MVLKAPTLTDAEIKWIKGENGERARINLRLMFLRMIKFYGFEYSASPEIISLQTSEKFSEKSKNWLTPKNHNYKRLTRILKCLMLCGLNTYAKELYDILKMVYENNKKIIGEETFTYWRNAINSSQEI